METLLSTIGLIALVVVVFVLLIRAESKQDRDRKRLEKFYNDDEEL